MIDVVGVLTKSGLSYLPEIFLDIIHRRDQHYRPRYPDLPFKHKPSAASPKYKQQLERMGYSNIDVPIKVVGVWDTVGSLGLPRVGILQNLGLQGAQSLEMKFYDTKIGSRVENAFQALALDERRSSFAPAVWEKPEGNRTRLRQVWFPGAHGNIGGGYDDQGMANITLAWMMDQLSPFLDMYDNYLLEAAHENNEYYREMQERRRPWSFGEIHNSLTGYYIAGGGKDRTPGLYFAVDPDTGRTTKRPLRDTHEYVHPSARVRYDLRGPGKEDKGDYDPTALLEEWKLMVEYPDGEGGKPDIYWKARFRGENVTTRELPESPLWSFERQLLSLDPKMERQVFAPPPTQATGRKSSGMIGSPPRQSFSGPPRQSMSGGLTPGGGSGRPRSRNDFRDDRDGRDGRDRDGRNRDGRDRDGRNRDGRDRDLRDRDGRDRDASDRDGWGRDGRSGRDRDDRGSR
jgi:hypothetical protein